ncbi:Lrp/AsnC family transcriptional regulator [Novosphingobium sp. Leaf2]|uniref:Lrp/AsnC family transcriptional regulator n=1 Tax=Novosphingobium sp. Leaf2 TaxID=1735670 RepID=UPI0006FF051C|nr:Lrp/AsnC family transcriptional regulator [Novosphingobium sp. Leaf2]KQM18889.1 ArsR family transcriptional regulator [Novosphingobium sp. Leaf2]
MAEIDAFDEKIIAVLAVDGRITMTDLARQVGLSKTPCQVRVRKLIDAGVIGGFRAVINHASLGLDHIAFVEVKLSDTREQALDAFNKAAIAITQVEACHMIAGSYDYLLKIRSRDIKDFRQTLGESISVLPNVASTSTFVAMQTIKE